MATTIDPAGQVCRVHFLDVGPKEYGDALLCQFGTRAVLIDGAHPGDQNRHGSHPSIPEQLEQLLGSEAPHDIDLLIVSHAHQDHIGCLPKLVEDGVIQVRWALVSDPDLGWGRARDEDRDAAITDARVRRVVEALRDECAPLDPATSDERLAEILDASETLETTYRRMLDRLREAGTRIVRFGQDDVRPMETDLTDIGLRVVGPSREQVLECADIINRKMQDAITHATDLFAADAALDPLDVYRRLVRGDVAGGTLDALDASRPGPAVNLQSIVTSFAFAGRKFLFGGDMQFADPQVDNATVEEAVVQLRQKIGQEAPYTVAKLSHHGSNNAFSEAIFQELRGTKLFGICAGEDSTHHPHPATLGVLRAHRTQIKWVRTDHNGRVTMSFGATTRIRLTQGNVNDPRPNSTDIPVPEPEPEPPPTPAPVTGETGAGPVVVRRGAPDVVEVHAWVPHVATRVTITVDVNPAEEALRGGGAPESAGTAPDRLVVGGGRRQLPRLLVATQSRTLAQNIGAAESAEALAAIRASGLVLCDLPPGSAGRAMDAVRQRLRAERGIEGVLLLGGHDVLPHQRIDCLPSDLRARFGPSDDPDRFIVWSDAVYGDVDGDGLPEIPVSRIPDGKSAALVRSALSAAPATPQRRAGVRNVARPFAEPIFDALSGARRMLVSKPSTFDDRPPPALDGDQTYFMLHGDYVDGTRFWGEGTPNNREAVNLGSLPSAMRGVVFTGCCWGALTTDTPAGLVSPGRPFGMKTPESSIALGALRRGALAFVGCTGAHYSPVQSPYDYFGGPMHRAFWRQHASGSPPAKALFDAKVEYLAGMPHGRTSDTQTAIEFKILRQYTCLGLGW
jgi:beta-lactamase superfamily II metal-dependent hydrolase